MKIRQYLLLLIVALMSCNKEESEPPVIDVQDFYFASDRILQRSQKAFNVGVWSMTQWYGAENFSLTVNGVKAELSKIPKSSGATGTMLLFDVPAIDKAGDYKAIFTHKMGKSTFTSEKTIRVVDDFSLPNIWNNLNKSYVKENPIFVYIYSSESEGFWFYSPKEIVLASNTVNGTQLGIGEYRTVFTDPHKLFVSNPLIAGLDGEYHVYYKGDQIEEMRVIFQEVYDEPKLDINNILNQMTDIYGPEVGYTGSHLFRSGAFDIQIRAYSTGFIQAIVKKVR